MKRAPVLLPLSREHHTALSLARRCERAAQSGDTALIATACEEALNALAGPLKSHFETEENALLPLLQDVGTQPLVARTLADHRQLHELRAGLLRMDATVLEAFAKTMIAHVRFEERELFPAIEARL